MPTMPERMATVETEVKYIRTKVDSIEGKVDTLVAAEHRRRGAAAQRQMDWKKAGISLTFLTIVINVLFNLPEIAKAVGQ